MPYLEIYIQHLNYRIRILLTGQPPSLFIIVIKPKRRCGLVNIRFRLQKKLKWDKSKIPIFSYRGKILKVNPQRFTSITPKGWRNANGCPNFLRVCLLSGSADLGCVYGAAPTKLTISRISGRLTTCQFGSNTLTSKECSHHTLNLDDLLHLSLVQPGEWRVL